MSRSQESLRLGVDEAIIARMYWFCAVSEGLVEFVDKLSSP